MRNTHWGTTKTDFLTLFFCRLGIAGLAPKAPGTVGTLVAALLAPICFLPLPIFWRIAVLILIFFLGAFAGTHAEKVLHSKDPGQIVIDELVGMWITLLPFAYLGLYELSLGFILFRIFDIFKPWPIKASEKWLPSGYAIMIDDVIAGIFAMLCLILLT